MAITQLLLQNAAQNANTVRQRFEKDLKYLKPFEDNVTKLLSFTETIERVLGDYRGQEQAVFRIIYDLKIIGSTKNFLTLNSPQNWETCKTKVQVK